MADENRPLKYLRYAIGEIVLVVIGILIALQINNWKQEKTNQRKEQFYLNGLKNDLSMQRVALEENILFENKMIKICNSLLQDHNRLNGFKAVDSLFYKLNYLIILTSPRDYKTTFNELNSTGQIELISDGNLRTQIIDFYQYSDNLNEIMKVNLRNLLMSSLHPIILSNSSFNVDVFFESGLAQNREEIKLNSNSERMNSIAMDQITGPKNELELVNTIHVRLGISIIHKERFTMIKSRLDELLDKIED